MMYVAFIIVTLEASSHIDTHNLFQPPEVLAGSTLLQVIDRFALNNHNISHKVTSDNIGKLENMYS